MKNNSVKRPRLFYGWVVLAVIFVTLVLGYAIRNTFSVFYPTIVAGFGWQRGDTALMFSITVLVYGLVAPLAGSLIDRFGPRLVLPVGAFIMGGGLALCSLSTTQWQFYLLFGVLSAAGLSMVGWTPSVTIASNWFVKKRGLAFGVLGAGFGTSMVAAPVAQYLITSFSWQTAYVIIGLFVTVVTVPLCAVFIRGKPGDKGLLPDGLPANFPELDKPLKNINPQADARADTTWTFSRVIRTYRFWLIFLISFSVWGVAEQIMIAHEVYFFQDVGYASMAAANIYSVTGIAFVAGTMCASFSDRLGREMIFIPACLLTALAVSLLFFIPDTSRTWLCFLFASLFGLGLGSTGPILSATTADLFHGKHFGSIQGTVTLGFALGGALAPWLAGFLHDRTGNYTLSFIIVIAGLVVSAAFMWIIAPRKVHPVNRN